MWESKLRNFLERVFTILPFDKVGQRIYDGTVYAGTSPDTGTALYAMPKDAPGVKQWKEAMAYAAHANELRAFGHNEGRCLCNMSRSGQKRLMPIS